MTDEKKPEAPKAPNGQWKKKIDASRRKRDTFNKVWQENVSFRKNKVYPVSNDTTTQLDTQDRIAVPVDSTRTKNKTAQLFFQVPKVNLRPRRPEFEGSAAVAGSALNFELEHEMRVHTLMDECLGDVINASGIMAAMVGFDAQTEQVMVDAIDPSQYAPEQIEQIKVQNGGQLPQMPSTRTIYQCYYADRISPAQLIWPADFTGSDFQKADYLGYDGKCSRAEALRNEWIDEDYECDDADTKLETMSSDTENDPDSKSIGKYVRFTRLWYRKSVIDPMEKDPRKIGHLVLVEGKDDPVINEDFKWQAYDPASRTWGGMITYPIKVGTLTSISDEAVPPSDSEIGRAQVMELNESRSDMIRQRKDSKPMRWIDVNMVDDMIAERISNNTWQGVIPMNGPGTNAIGEVARANYPRESFQFQQIIERDLDNAWSEGANQQGFANAGDTSAAEAKIMASAAQIRLEYERARVLRFFVEIAEATFALLQLFQDDEKWVEIEGADGLKKLEPWNKSRVRGDFAFVVKPDAAARVDAGQERVDSLNAYKLLRRDPAANGVEILKRALIAHGYDLATTLVPPPKPEPKPAALRYTFKGEDLTNPIVVALAQKNSPTPLTPEDITNASAMMAAAKVPNMVPEVMPVPQPNSHGQLPTIEQVESGRAKHPGPPAQVDPLGQRYSQGNPEDGVSE